MIDSPSNSDGFEEVMIYSQESPKSGETFRDFDWANFLFLKYLKYFGGRVYCKLLQWPEEDIIAPNRLRATFPRRRGGMGFTTLKDVLPGAFAATILECLYPRGLNVLGAPKREGVSLRAGCPAIDRPI